MEYTKYTTQRCSRAQDQTQDKMGHKTQTKDLTREPRTQDPKVTQRHKTGHKTHSPTVAQEPLRGDTWSGTPEVHNSQLLHKKHHMFIVQAGCP